MPDTPQLLTLGGRPQTWKMLHARLEALTRDRQQLKWLGETTYARWLAHKARTA